MTLTLLGASLATLRTVLDIFSGDRTRNRSWAVIFLLLPPGYFSLALQIVILQHCPSNLKAENQSVMIWGSADFLHPKMAQRGQQIRMITCC